MPQITATKTSSYIRCDTVSAFCGKGKVKALKIMLTDAKFVEFFESIGGDWTTSDEIYTCAEEFICHLYGFNGICMSNEGKSPPPPQLISATAYCIELKFGQLVRPRVLSNIVIKI